MEEQAEFESYLTSEAPSRCKHPHPETKVSGDFEWR